MSKCCKKTERIEEDDYCNDIEKGNMEVVDELTSFFKRFND